MMDQLLIWLLPPRDGEHYAEWAILSGQSIAATSQEAKPLADLQAALPAGSTSYATIILVPGSDVLLTTVQVPAKQRRHVHKILPYLIEEQLADDIASLHIVNGKVIAPASEVAIAVVRRQQIEHWLDRLQAVGIFPQVMLADSLLLPYRLGEWSALFDTGMAWLCTGPSQRYAVEREMLEATLTLLPQNAIPVHCYITVSPEASQEMDVQALSQMTGHPTIQVTPVDSALSLFCRTLLEQGVPELNLLAGPFAPLRPVARTHKPWRRVAQLAAIGVVLQMSLDLGQALYLSYQATQYRHAAAALYHQWFPDDQKITDPIRQTNAHLSANPASGGPLSLLHQLAAHWPREESAQPAIQSISYSRTSHHLEVSVTAKSVEAMSALAQHLESDRGSVKVISMSSDHDSVKGQLVIEEKQ